MPRLAPEEVTLVDVAEIGADPAHRTALTPFGALPGRKQRYVGKAVLWKRNPAAMPSAVEAGLSKAKAISKGCSGVKGLAIHPTKGTVIPNKALCQIKKGKAK